MEKSLTNHTLCTTGIVDNFKEAVETSQSALANLLVNAIFRP